MGRRGSKEDKRKPKVEDDQKKTPTCHFVPRVLPRDGYCFSRTLNPNEVFPVNPELFLKPNEALYLTGSPDSKNLVIFDEENRKYNMLFSHYLTWRFVRYSISQDWETFVSVHNLKAGDEILFYRFSDTSVCDGYYYILKYVRKSLISEKPSDDAGKQVEDKKKKKLLPGPGSRPLPSSACCLSKTLTSHEVVQENPKLYFDPNDAIELANFPELVLLPPGTYSKDLLVFDGDDRQYTMKLSHDISRGRETSYCLNTGWRAFLLAHDLKEGDRLAFYRFFDITVFTQDYYYVLKYFTEPKVDKSPHDIKNAETGRKLQCWMAKKAEIISLLELCELVEKEHEDGDATKRKDKMGPQMNEITEENKQNESSTVEDDQSEKKEPVMVPRSLTSEFLCLSKTLTSYEVVQENPKLYFDPNDAIILANSPEIEGNTRGTYSKDLMVFDEDDRQYTMNLSRNNTSGPPETSYCLNTGWRAYLRAHDLKEGDRLAFYRFSNESVSDQDYFVLVYFRKPAHIVDWFKKKPCEEAKVGAPINEITEENKQNEWSKVEDDQSERKSPGPVPSDVAGQQVEDMKKKKIEPGPGSSSGHYITEPKVNKSPHYIKNVQGPISETTPSDVGLKADRLAEARRKLQDCKAKRAEIIALLQLMELLAEKKRKDGDATKGKDKFGAQINEITEENKQNESSKVEDDQSEKECEHSKSEPNKDTNASVLSPDKTISSSYKKESEHSESEPNKDTNTRVLSPDKPISSSYENESEHSESEPNKDTNASVLSPDKPISSSYKKESEHRVSEPNKDTNASVLISPDKRQDSKVKGNEAALASLLKLYLEADIEEAEWQIEYWKMKKSQAVELLELCRGLAKGWHQDRA